MPCPDFERLVALHIEGDMEASERPRVDTHLEECPACCELARDLKESQALFKLIRQDVPDRAMLLSVRARVLDSVAGLETGSRIERFLFGGLRQKATLACIVLLIAAGSALWLSGRAEAPPQPMPAVAVSPRSSTPVQASKPVLRGETPAPHRKAKIRQPAPVRPINEAPKEQVTIKLLTDDPNVIIYWVVDEKGD